MQKDYATMFDATILLTTFNRDQLLQLGLESIRRWNPDVKILVLNDGDVGNVPTICNKYTACYLFTGINKHAQWRIPGYALNIGIKQTSTSIVILSCAEMWHFDDCLTPMIAAVYANKMVLAIPNGKDDMEKRFLPNLDNEQKYNECVALKTELPFLMAVHRQHLLDIGGYDESLTGQSYDDDRLVECLQLHGCFFEKVNARCVHLYHPRFCHDKRSYGRLATNKKIYEEKRKQKVSNVGKKWGVL